MLVQSKDAASSAIVLTTATQAGKISDVGKLVFNRYGDQYFLSKIWVPSSDTGRELAANLAWSVKWPKVCRKVEPPL